MKKHRGNLTIIFSFAFLSIAVLVSALMWTSATKYTTKNRASSGTNQYSTVSLSNLLESAIIKDIGNMTATKGNDFITNVGNTADAMLQAMQNSQFALSTNGTVDDASDDELVYKVSEPLNIIKNTAINIQRVHEIPDGLSAEEQEEITEHNKALAADTQQDLAEFARNAKMKCTLYTEIKQDGVVEKVPQFIYDHGRVVKDSEGNISSVYLQPFYITLQVSKGTLTVTQLYKITDATVIFWKASDGFYAALKTNAATVEKVSQNISSYVLNLEEPSGS